MRSWQLILQSFLISLVLAPQLAFSHDDHSHGYTWPEGKKAAVVLTYDDAADTQLDIAWPQLQAAGFNATFYISGVRDSFSQRMDEWKAVAEQGSELGNHTLHHPCQKSLPNRDWVAPHHDSDTYSVGRILDEVSTMNILLEAIDGKTQRSYAYPCGETQVQSQSYIEGLKPYVWAARNGNATGLNDANDFDRYQIGARDVSGMSGKEMINVVEKSLAENSLVVLIFHGVGGDFLEVSAEAHQQLVRYLSLNQSLYWVDSLDNVLSYIDQQKH